MRKIALSTALLLAACGGGSGGSGKPAPSPTPAPAPAPTPAPTPTPAPSYPASITFSQSAFAESPAAEVTLTEIYDPASPRFYRFDSAAGSIAEAPSAATLTWDVPTRVATVRLNDVLSTYSPADLDTHREDVIRFVQRPDPDIERTFTWARAEAFVSLSSATQTERRGVFIGADPKRVIELTRYFLAGPRTLPGDTIGSGALTYSGNAIGTIAAPADAGPIVQSASVALNSATGEVKATWTAGGRSYDVVATFSRARANHIEGTITSGGQTGRVVGNLYGSQGRELGLLFSIPGNAFAAAGYVTARRN